MFFQGLRNTYQSFFTIHRYTSISHFWCIELFFALVYRSVWQVFFGENHNDPISHWLQFELTKSLFNKHKTNLMLGAEMIESDNQIQLNEYLRGFIREKDFEKESKLWTNYKTDYKPLVNFAKENNLHFVATNVPRRFASMV